MKHIKFILSTLILTGLMACEEVPPPIDYTVTEPFVTDTYVLSSITQPAQDKGILIEDLTGVRCPNCVDAASKAKQLKAQNSDRVVVVGVYTLQPTNLTFPHTGDVDLRTEEATNLYTNIYGSPPLPGGGVNRKIHNGQTSINHSFSQWASSVQSELSLKSQINLNATSSKLNDSTLNLKADITFMEAMSGQVFISIMLLENDLEAVQSSPSGDIEDYVHEHVLRDMYTPYNGTPLFKDAEKGRYLEAEWTLQIPSHVNIANSSVVILINRNDAENKEVLQCLEVTL